MKNATNTHANPVRNTIIAIALAAAVCAPATAFAATGNATVPTSKVDSANITLAIDDARANTQHAALGLTNDYGSGNAYGLTDNEDCEDGCYASNKEYVDSLTGLTDAEKQELVQLYDKLDALAENEDLSDAEWNRMTELEDKAWYSEASEYINSDTSISEEQRAHYLDQLNQLKELDKYFANPTLQEKWSQYDSIYESLGEYFRWDQYYDDYGYGYDESFGNYGYDYGYDGSYGNYGYDNGYDGGYGDYGYGYDNNKSSSDSGLTAAAYTTFATLA